jgi:hypothetical protein
VVIVVIVMVVVVIMCHSVFHPGTGNDGALNDCRYQSVPEQSIPGATHCCHQRGCFLEFRGFPSLNPDAKNGWAVFRLESRL